MNASLKIFLIISLMLDLNFCQSECCAVVGGTVVVFFMGVVFSVVVVCGRGVGLSCLLFHPDQSNGFMCEEPCNNLFHFFLSSSSSSSPSSASFHQLYFLSGVQKESLQTSPFGHSHIQVNKILLTLPHCLPRTRVSQNLSHFNVVDPAVIV